MVPEEVCRLLKNEFQDAIVETVLEGGHPYAVIAPAAWPKVALFLRDDSRLRLNFLRCITALDLLADNKLACVYDLMYVPLEEALAERSDSPARTEARESSGRKVAPAREPAALITSTSEFAVRVVTDRDNPAIPSVAHVWPAADWHEREAYDLMGIIFTGHPDFRRILCPDDWEGHPLRKDYAFPLEYHGIPATTEFELTNPRH